MPINPKEVKGELALELDTDHVSANDFINAVEAFVGLIKEITKNINASSPRNAWEIQVQEGSQIINVIPNADAIRPQVSNQIVNAVLDGITLLENSAEKPNQYSDKAIEHMKTLSNLTSRESNNIPIRILSRDIARTVTRNTYNHTSELLSWKYEDSGTVEGTLDVVSAHKGYEFRIAEPVFGRTVKCTIDENMLAVALNAFKKRVEVDGLIRYDKDGYAKSIKVKSISVFPATNSLPGFKELRGILGNT